MLGRACAIAAGCFVAFALWSSILPGEAQGDHLELRIDFAVREWLGRTPALDPRLKIFVLDDPTVSFLQSGDLALPDWAQVLEALAAREPARIMIDKLFDLPRDPSQVPDFVARIRKLRVPIVTGAFAAPQRIQGRQALSLDAAWNDIRHLSDAAGATHRLGASPKSARHAYGPHPSFWPALRYLGHIGYRGIGRVTAIERLDARAILPHAALLVAAGFDVEDGELVANGVRVPLQDGGIQVNMASTAALEGRSYSMKTLITRAREQRPISVVGKSDVVLILPGMHTGNADWLMTPVGQIAGGHVLASVINSVLTGAWLRTLDFRLPLLAGAVLLGFVFGLTLFGRALWIVATGTVIAICLAGLASFAYASLVVPWILPASAFFLTAMTIFVERSKAERGHRLRMEAELETAGLVQRSFFPKQTRQRGAVRVVGHCRPATQCGGDWWWHFSPAPGVELVLIGDVTGHGTPAALVTSALYSAVCTMIDLRKRNADVELSPTRILQSLNHMLFESLRGERLVTMFVACFDTNTGMLTYGNSAHHFPLVFRGGKRISFEAVRPGSMLGIDATGSFPEGRMALAAGDKYVLYTDGIIECSTGAGKPLGWRGFATLAAQHAHAEAKSMAEGLSSHLAEVFGNDALDDDCTFVIVEIPASGQTSSLSA